VRKRLLPGFVYLAHSIGPISAQAFGRKLHTCHLCTKHTQGCAAPKHSHFVLLNILKIVHGKLDTQTSKHEYFCMKCQWVYRKRYNLYKHIIHSTRQTSWGVVIFVPNALKEVQLQKHSQFVVLNVLRVKYSLDEKWPSGCRLKTAKNDCQVGVSSRWTSGRTAISHALFYSTLGRRQPIITHICICCSTDFALRECFGGRCDRCSAWLIPAPLDSDTVLNCWRKLTPIWAAPLM